MRFNARLIGVIIIGIALLRLGMLAVEEARLPSEKKSSVVAVQKRRACRVLTVYDGDTLGCDLNANGRIERPREEVRLLGIDTPEMRYSKKNRSHGSAHPKDEPYAREASQWLYRQAFGKMVYLEFDVQARDRYGRTLAFVYPAANATSSFNAELLRQGYAKMLFLGRNRLHEETFRVIETEARQAVRGLWRVE
jgi:micrococcal nuclease